MTDLFPDGHVVNLHPWEYNEVPVVLGAAFASKYPIVALHLTRPPVEIPDRKAMGMDSHFDAAKGAYLIRDWDPSRPKMGTVLVQGTMSTVNLVKALPEINSAGLNVRIVAAISPQLFAEQPREYRESLLPEAAQFRPDGRLEPFAPPDVRLDEESDRLRVLPDLGLGRSLAHGAVPWTRCWRKRTCRRSDILKGIERFAKDRDTRLARLARPAGLDRVRRRLRRTIGLIAACLPLLGAGGAAPAIP